MIKNPTSSKSHLSKLLSVFFFLLLLGAYTHIFAIGSPYSAGDTLDPACAPGDTNCTVNVNKLVNTTYNSGSPLGIIYKGTTPFIHNFNYGNNGTVTTDGYNTFVGENSGNLTMGSTATNIYEGSYNTGIGYQSLYSNTTGFWNTANGYKSLFSNTTGYNNHAIGYKSLYSNTTGFGNSASGAYSLIANTTGYANTGDGLKTLYSNTTGVDNTAIGATSLYWNTSGNHNTAVGYAALLFNTTGNNNTANGDSSLYSNTTGISNTSSGYLSLFNNTTGNNNTANGDSSLYSNTTGSYNTAIGAYSIYANSTGSGNVALGYYAGRYETGSNSFYVDNQNRTNTAGDKAGALLYGTFNATASSQTLTTNSAFTATYGMNIPTGQTYKVNGVSIASPITVVNTSNLFSTGLSGTGSGVTTIVDSIFLGASAGSGATSANNSNFFGSLAGYNASGANSSNFFGANAGRAATSALNSNFIGQSAGMNATSALSSNFLGYGAGFGATNANGSNFLGENAGNGSTGASNSNFFGYNNGGGSTNASYSNLFGFQVGYNAGSNNIGSNNIIIGTNISLPNATTNSMNLGAVLFGTGTYSTTTGNPSITPIAGGKIGIGVVSPLNTLHVTAAPATGTHTARIANTLGGTTQNNGLLVLAGNNTGVAASEMITFQRTDATVIGSISQNAATTVAYNTSSDRRIKQNIQDTSYGLSDLMKIQVQDFTFINDPTHKQMTGFIAQDLNEIFPGAVTTNGDNGTDSLLSNQTPWMVDYSKLTPLIIKSIQDMELKIESIEELNNSLDTNTFGSLIKSFFENSSNWIERIFVKNVVTEGIQIKDSVTGEYYCVLITNGEFNKTKGECSFTPVVTEEPTPVVEDQTQLKVTNITEEQPPENQQETSSGEEEIVSDGNTIDPNTNTEEPVLNDTQNQTD